jgi:hypothetical protein
MIPSRGMNNIAQVVDGDSGSKHCDEVEASGEDRGGTPFALDK